jgi:hypothetical protein
MFHPTAVGWKLADEVAYKQMYDELKPFCDRTVETWMNGRWIANMHLKDELLEGGITLIKVMQRRPGSDDALGLDHVDFMCADAKRVEAQLKQSDLRWTWESNDVITNYSWISVWFDGGEAKLKEGTVLDTIVKELEEINTDIKSPRG